jgi:LacI family transcriptional regulator
MNLPDTIKTSAKNARRSTMIDVAKAAGVSLKTVSRVLNDEVYVKEDTRRIVVDAANVLKYRMNQAARTLRAGSAQIIVLLVNNPSRSYLENLHFGALKRCHRLGMQLVLDECEDGIDGIRRVLDALSPAGFIIAPPLSDNPDILAFLDERKIPYVVIAPDDPANVALSVSIDDELAAREMTEHLISLGHRNIAFIRGHPTHSAANKRFAGYISALMAHGIAIDDTIIAQGYFDWASGLKCAEALLDLPSRPTAVFASNDDMAASVISAAYRRNIHVPRELSVVGFDDSQIAGIISPQLTTVFQPISELASTAVDLLNDALSPMQHSARNIMFEHRIVQRESTGKPAL